MNAKAHSDIRRKLKALNYAKEIGNITKACRYFKVSGKTPFTSGKGLTKLKGKQS